MRTGSKSLQITPADGDAFLTSAIKRHGSVAQVSDLRVHRASRPVFHATRRRVNPQPGRLRYGFWAAQRCQKITPLAVLQHRVAQIARRDQPRGQLRDFAFFCSTILVRECSFATEFASETLSPRTSRFKSRHPTRKFITEP